MHRIYLWGIFFTYALIYTACQSPSDLLQSGSHSFSIYIPEEADSITYQAAKEFQFFTSEISGVDLPISRIPGPSQVVLDNQLPGEQPGIAWHYSPDENQLVIQGSNSEYLLYSVYDFLERIWGIRFLAPEVNHLPHLSSFELDTLSPYSYAPDITTRTVHSRLYYENPRYAHRRKATTESFPHYVPAARVHTFHRMVPAENYFDAHPEYYAMRNGKRVPTQLCLTNKKVQEIVMGVVDSLFKSHPHRDVISVSQDDNQLYCQCAECAAVDKEEGSHAGTMIRFVNAVAKEFPEKTISTLAYQYTRKAPAVTIPESNVLITLCSIECDRSGPIEEKCKDFTDDLKAWGKISNNIRIWDYTTQFTNFLAPFPNIHTLKPNIQLFRDNSTEWVFEQHSNNPSELFELRSYLTARLLWDPELDWRKEVEEFNNLYYGRSGEFVSRYVFSIHDEIQQEEDFFLFLYGDPSQAFDSFLSDSLLVHYNRLYQQALDQAETLEIKDRLKFAKMSIDYASLEAARTGMEHFHLQTDAQREITEDRLKEFYATAQSNQVTLMNEMGFTVEEYVDHFKNVLTRVEGENLALRKTVQLISQPKKYANEDPQVLTDGKVGGTGFYADWLGFEGNDMEVILDLGEPVSIEEISVHFLQVRNHLVFLPESLKVSISNDNANFESIGIVESPSPLEPDSKVNLVEEFRWTGKTQAQYIKLTGVNRKKVPEWHNGAGLGAWVFADEIVVR